MHSKQLQSQLHQSVACVVLWIGCVVVSHRSGHWVVNDAGIHTDLGDTSEVHQQLLTNNPSCLGSNLIGIRTGWHQSRCLSILQRRSDQNSCICKAAAWLLPVGLQATQSQSVSNQKHTGRVCWDMTAGHSSAKCAFQKSPEIRHCCQQCSVCVEYHLHCDC